MLHLHLLASWEHMLGTAELGPLGCRTSPGLLLSRSLVMPSLPCLCLVGNNLLAVCLSRHLLHVVMQISSADSAARDALTFQLPSGPKLSEAAVISVLTQVDI